jgi:hypothetical protein
MADTGEGGLRWVEGKRMNWAAYSREEPMVEVNDADADYLVRARQRGLRIAANKSKKAIVASNLRRLAYAVEYARTDRRRLLKEFRKFIKTSLYQ